MIHPEWWAESARTWGWSSNSCRHRRRDDGEISGSVRFGGQRMVKMSDLTQRAKSVLVSSRKIIYAAQMLAAL